MSFRDQSADIDSIRLPQRVESPWVALYKRLVLALAILVFTVLLVWLHRDGYVDVNDPHHEVDLVDATYYTTVTLSTTGYGDIVPVSPSARMVNAFVITPLRIGFLALLISSTLEVLASQGRARFRAARWRKHMEDHYVVIGYGTKGRRAARTLVNNGVEVRKIVVVDPRSDAQMEANADGFAVINGDATRRDVLHRAGIVDARRVLISTDRDDSTVLATLTVRQLNPDVSIVAVVREAENVPLAKQSGADNVVTYGEGLEVAERDILVNEVGKQPQQLPDQVIAVLRDEKVFRYFDPVVTQLARGDKVIVVRAANDLPWAPRPGTHGEAFADDED